MFTDGKKILFTRRDIPPAKGMWHMPGGSVLFGESIDEAIKRVAKDEVGLQVLNSKLMGFCEYCPEHAFGQSVSLVFQINQFNGTPAGSDQAKNLGFFDYFPEETIPETKQFIQKNLNW